MTYSAIGKARLALFALLLPVLLGAQACSQADGGGNGAVSPSAISSGADLAAKPGGITAVQLNLSHIECVAGSVEVHFVLLHVPAGATIGNLVSYNNGVAQSPVAPGPQTGNAQHFSVIAAPGIFNVTAATVQVNGTTKNLHNPGEYLGHVQLQLASGVCDVPAARSVLGRPGVPARAGKPEQRMRSTRPGPRRQGRPRRLRAASGQSERRRLRLSRTGRGAVEAVFRPIASIVPLPPDSFSSVRRDGGDLARDVLRLPSQLTGTDR